MYLLQLIEFFTISPAELEFIQKKRNEANKLGFACIYKFFQIEAIFPKSLNEIPDSVVSFLAALTFQIH